MSENEQKVNKIVERIYSGELSTPEDIKMALKLILNANGTELATQKDNIKSLVEYATGKKEIDGKIYIPVEDVFDIVDSV